MGVGTSCGKVIPVGGWTGHIGDRSEEQQQLTRSKILIVGGSGPDRKSVHEALGPLDLELFEASTTSEAISAISIHSADLVLIDMSVPELGAIEFCRMLKKAAATQFLPLFVMAD